MIMQTLGGDNDYVKVPILRRPPRPQTVPPGSSLFSELPTRHNAPPTPPADENPPPEQPAAEPNPAVPIVYETLRQDATGGNVLVQMDVTYVFPEAVQEQAAQPVDQTAQPVDLTDLLANQQANAAAVSGGDLGSAAAVISQPLSFENNACQQPCDVYYVDNSLNVVEPSISSPQSVYTNMDGHNLSEALLQTSIASLQLDSTTDASETNGEADSTTATTSDVLHPTTSDTVHQHRVLARSATVGPMPGDSAATESFAFRLPSYEESMYSDATGVSLSPAASPLSPESETSVEASTSTSASTSASALPGYESPPSYVSDKLLELNANTPLKSRQVQQLQDEMSNDAGIRVQLDKTQCAQALALFDCFGRVW